ncbi:hypothetical protein QNH20_11835 [Neobacillus sp. WH10]|uniref:hypothetical protein n=1 Tax=Neobacillus sp. WH10 TaxID=3047873 RepID=UPI0024C18543|nr:hypothetical protein [Neobacillus sp. WH10]WHY79789.1 hypothetical protein QNH20_11835 [Neobacillus sp. WH10]
MFNSELIGVVIVRCEKFGMCKGIQKRMEGAQRIQNDKRQLNDKSYRTRPLLEYYTVDLMGRHY